MKKYIIKNCPAYNPKHCDCLNTKEIACLYRADCVMKRIYDECKQETEIDVDLRGDLAERVMSEFEIQEVE